MSFVADCSALAGAWLDDEPNALALHLIEEAALRPLRAPSLLTLEFANTMLTAERRKRIDAAGRIDALNEFIQLPIVLEPPPAGNILLGISGLAQRFNLTVYAASYLELALRLKLPLATLDTRLAQAARASGVDVLPGPSPE